MLCACLLSLLLLALYRRGKQSSRMNLPVLSLLAYLALAAVSVCWATSGKFFLKEYAKLLFALPLYLFIVLYLPRTEAAIRRLLLVLTGAGALFALLSVDMATLCLTKPALLLLPNFASVNTGFEIGTRLTGLFGNPNILAGLLGISIIFTVYLLESAETKWQRAYAAFIFALQTYTFLLAFSLGASGFFLVAVAIYLLCAGPRLGSVLLRMLGAAIPTVGFVFLSFSYFEASGAALAVPLAADLCCGLCSVALELAVYPRLAAFLERRPRLPVIVCLTAVLLCGCYAGLGYLLGGEAALPSGGSLRRSVYPASGEYRLAVEADGDVQVLVLSQDDRDVVMHTESKLYSGPAADAVFTVPAESRVVYLHFTAQTDAVLHSAALVGADQTRLPVHLGYPLLPSFIANRLQGLRANQNAIQRAAFFRDGIRIFSRSPLLGSGLGSFESLICGYQDFHYETRYVHNQYIQVLLDNGILGLAAYGALLLSCLWSLWRARRKDAPLRRLYPAVCAAFAMVCLHSVMEVVMSTTIYLPYAFAVFGLVALCWGTPVLRRPAVALGGRCAFAAIALCYAILISLNLYAHSLVEGANNNYIQYFSALKRAASVDVFDKTDWKVSYIVSSVQIDRPDYNRQAHAYAEELIDTPSNSLHQYLVSFYLDCQEYAQALRAAEAGISFNYADADTWNNYFTLYGSFLNDHPESWEQVLAGVRTLNGLLQSYSERLLEPITLDEAAAQTVALALETT